MSVSSILTSSNPYLLSTANSLQQNFQKLGQALKSSNLSSAQSDFAALQSAFSQSASAATSSSSPTAQAFNQLGSDLKSGNLSAAQTDYSGLQNGLSKLGGTTSSGIHQAHGGPVRTDGPSTGNVLNQTGQDTTSTDLTGVQQAYATLQKAMQQFTLGGGAALGAPSLVSMDA